MINLRNEIDKLPDTNLWKPYFNNKTSELTNINTLLTQEQEKYQDILEISLLLKKKYFLLSFIHLYRKSKLLF